MSTCNKIVFRVNVVDSYREMIFGFMVMTDRMLRLHLKL